MKDLGIVLRREISGLSSLTFVIWRVTWILPFVGWSSTVAARVRLVISRLVLIFALPLDFYGRVLRCQVYVSCLACSQTWDSEASVLLASE